MTIQFDNIPSSIRKPGWYSEYNASLASQGLPENAKKVVIIGQKTSAGTGVSNVPVMVFNTTDAETYAGVGSVAALAAAAFLKANPNVELSIVPIPDGAGAAAVGTITIATNATSTGSIEFWIGNIRCEVTVVSGDSPSSIATAIRTAMLEIQNKTPILATVDGAVVTLTARNAGTLGNNIAVAYKKNNVSGTTVTVVQPTSGATDPSIATALSSIYSADFNMIFCTLNDATNLGLLKAHMQSVTSPTESKRVTAYYGYTGVQATLETLAGTTLNYERFSCAYIKQTKTTERGHSLDYEVGAAYSAIVAGESDPARPLNTLALPGISPCALEDKLSRSQQGSLLRNGVTPLEVGPGETVQIVRAVTNYTTDATGTKSVAYLDLTTILSMDYGDIAIRSREAQRFPREKKTERTKAKLKTEVLDVIRLLSELEIWNDVDSSEVIVENDLQAVGRLNVRIPAKVVAGLHVIANRLDLILS